LLPSQNGEVAEVLLESELVGLGPFSDKLSSIAIHEVPEQLLYLELVDGDDQEQLGVEVALAVVHVLHGIWNVEFEHLELLAQGVETDVDVAHHDSELVWEVFQS